MRTVLNRTGEQASDLPVVPRCEKPEILPRSRVSSLGSYLKTAALVYLATSGRQYQGAYASPQSAGISGLDLASSNLTPPPCDIVELCLPIAQLKGLSDIGVHVGHASQVMVAKFYDGTKAIFKPQTDAKYGEAKYEAAAFKLSLLFQLNLVPKTVFRSVTVGNDSMEGSVQKLVDGRHPQSWNPEAYPKLMFLDLLLANGDRHHENVLVESNGQETFVHAIDNNKSFRPFDKWKEPKILDNLAKNPKVYKVDAKTFSVINSVTKSEFESSLYGLVAPEYIENAWHRLQIFKKTIAPLMSSNSEWEILSGHSAQRRYEAILESDYVVKVKPLAEVSKESAKMSQSGADVFFVELSSGVRGIFKRDLPQSVGTYKHEIAAYQLSKVLDFNHVPPVVERKIALGDQEVVGSLQLFIPGCTHLYPERLHFRDFSRPNDLRYFDFALGIYSRHNGNYLIGLDDPTQYFAIDHANTFSKKSDQKILVDKWDQILPEISPQDDNLKLRLKSVTESEIRNSLTGWVESKWIDLVVKRILALKNTEMSRKLVKVTSTFHKSYW